MQFSRSSLAELSKDIPIQFDPLFKFYKYTNFMWKFSKTYGISSSNFPFNWFSICQIYTVFSFGSFMACLHLLQCFEFHYINISGKWDYEKAKADDAFQGPGVSAGFIIRSHPLYFRNSWKMFCCRHWPVGCSSFLQYFFKVLKVMLPGLFPIPLVTLNKPVKFQSDLKSLSLATSHLKFQLNSVM